MPAADEEVMQPPPAADEQVIMQPPPAADEQVVMQPPPAADEQVVMQPPPAADEQVMMNLQAADSEMPRAEEPVHLLCCICQQAMQPAEGLLALECSHVFHDSCIRNTWHHLAKPVGWCPNRCLDRSLAQEVPEEDLVVVDPESEVPPDNGEESFVL